MLPGQLRADQSRIAAAHTSMLAVGEGGCPLCLIERGGRIGWIKRCHIGLITHGLGGFTRPC